MSFDLRLTNGTFAIRSDGDIDRITGISKLSQDIVKVVVTPTGSHRAHPWYGSTLEAKISGSALTDELLTKEVEATVTTAIQNLIHLQQQQEQQGQFLTPDEAISSVTDVRLHRDSADQRQLIVIITIKTRSGRTISEQIGVSR